jgi:hypothetical protein
MRLVHRFMLGHAQLHASSAQDRQNVTLATLGRSAIHAWAA